MNQFKQWENEYRNPIFLTKDSKPQADTIKFLKFVKKQGIDISNCRLLDLGSGTGRNSNYIATLGADVTGIELSKTAVKLAKERAEELGLQINFIQGDIGEKIDFPDAVFDIVIDVMSSNSLSEKGRKIMLSEIARLIKDDGYFYTKALCKDGDKNAKELLKTNGGKEKDTYIMPETGITERVFSEEDFRNTYGKLFNIIHLEKKTNYVRFKNQSYKRNYWICYMKKKVDTNS